MNAVNMPQLHYVARAANSAPFTPTLSPRLSVSGIVVVVLLHAGVFWLLLQMNVIRLPDPLSLLSIRMIPPQVQSMPDPEPEPRRPEIRKPIKTPEPLPQPLRLALPADAPATVAATVSPPPVINSVSPAPTANIATPTPPRFEADYLENPAPRYPSQARQQRQQGNVMLRVNVDANGLPTEVLLLTSSGVDALDQSALNTVRRWRFIPAKFGNTAIAAWVQVPINFHLKD